MPDREKVIKEYEDFVNGYECFCTSDDYEYEMHKAVLALLKEQEAVEPIYIENPYTHLPVSYCPKCKEPINQYITGDPYRETKYCHYCGQAVKWDEC